MSRTITHTRAWRALGLSALAWLVCWLVSPRADAWETDDFSLPPAPLVDLAPEFERYLEVALQRGIDRANQQIGAHEACLALTGKRRWPRECYLSRQTLIPAFDQRESLALHESRLLRLRSGQGIAGELYRILGDGVLTSEIEDYFNRGRFDLGGEVRFRPPFKDSIFVARYPVYSTSAPTISLYGMRLGTDKVGHIFQQGHSYYERYLSARAKGASEAEATQSAVDWGVFMEDGLYGTGVSGIFSNGDLAANYLGLLWYRNLSEPIRLADAPRAALARVNASGRWELTRDRPQGPGWMRPYIRPHLNEALNASVWDLKTREELDAAIARPSRQICARWYLPVGLSPAPIVGQSRSVLPSAESFELIDGVPYGHRWQQSRMGGIVQECPEIANSVRKNN